MSDTVWIPSSAKVHARVSGHCPLQVLDAKNKISKANIAPRVSKDDLQLLTHLCSNPAISPTSSICFINSASPTIELPPTSILVRYSGISSLLPLLSFPLSRPSGLAELYLPAPGISRASAAEAAAGIEDVRV